MPKSRGKSVKADSFASDIRADSAAGLEGDLGSQKFRRPQESMRIVEGRRTDVDGEKREKKDNQKNRAG